jgi:hypothetical protein
MKITFEEGRDNGYEEYFAISQLEVYRGKAYDELMWAEIAVGELTDKIFKTIDGGNTYRVMWEDDWQNPEFFSTLAECKAHILKTFHRHTPHVNGVVFDINEL